MFICLQAAHLQPRARRKPKLMLRQRSRGHLALIWLAKRWSRRLLLCVLSSVLSTGSFSTLFCCFLQCPGNDLKKELGAISGLLLECGCHDQLKTGCSDLQKWSPPIQQLFGRQVLFEWTFVCTGTLLPHAGWERSPRKRPSQLSWILASALFETQLFIIQI